MADTQAVPNAIMKSLGETLSNEENDQSSTHLTATFVNHDEEGSSVESRLASFPRTMLVEANEQFEALSLC